MRKIIYHKKCLKCEYEQEGKTEYLGFSFWFCEKCNAMNLEVGLRIENEENKNG